MKALYTARIGGVAQDAFFVVTNQNGGAPGRTKINWPFGTLRLYPDRITFRLIFGEFELPLEDITSIERHMLVQVRIQHTNPDVPQYIALHGLGLLGRLKSAAKAHRVRLPFKQAA
ncbi:MAG: hypothetical protein ACI8QC_001080 [Planctomycetota bacterium]|jgi:hypothetical protein